MYLILVRINEMLLLLTLRAQQTYVISVRVRSYLLTFAIEITMKDVQKVKIA